MGLNRLVRVGKLTLSLTGLYPPGLIYFSTVESMGGPFYWDAAFVLHAYRDDIVCFRVGWLGEFACI